MPDTIKPALIPHTNIQITDNQNRPLFIINNSPILYYYDYHFTAILVRDDNYSHLPSTPFLPNVHIYENSFDDLIEI